jgi:hypothetical protein
VSGHGTCASCAGLSLDDSCMYCGCCSGGAMLCQ